MAESTVVKGAEEGKVHGRNIAYFLHDCFHRYVYKTWRFFCIKRIGKFMQKTFKPHKQSHVEETVNLSSYK